MGLRDFRIAKGLTLSQVGAKLHVATSTVCLWEKGVRRPKLKNVLALSKLYGVGVGKIAKAVA